MMPHTKALLSSILLSSLISGCFLNDPTTTPEALAVKILTELPNNSDCRPLGNVQYTYTTFFENDIDRPSVRRTNEAILRNKAAAKGGNALFIQPDAGLQNQTVRQTGVGSKQFNRQYIAIVFQCPEQALQ